jgi:hypothetical protein
LSIASVSEVAIALNNLLRSSAFILLLNLSD